MHRYIKFLLVLKTSLYIQKKEKIDKICENFEKRRDIEF